MPDKDAKECYDCAVAFTSWRRKHHCRICGAIFCSRCASNLVPGQRFGSAGYIRVCNICLAKLEPIPDAPPRALGRDDVEDDSVSRCRSQSPDHVLVHRTRGSNGVSWMHCWYISGISRRRKRDRVFIYLGHGHMLLASLPVEVKRL